MTTAGQRRQAPVPTDGHAGADLLDDKPNLVAPGYHEAFDDWRFEAHIHFDGSHGDR